MADTTPITAESMPAGEYAIVEMLGHRTMVGRVSEVERFGTKLLMIEPLFADTMLGPVLLPGTSLYQFTPCSAEVAFNRRVTRDYNLPGPVLDAAALPEPEFKPAFLCEDDEQDF